MNRQQQRQNAKDQKRLEQHRKARQKPGHPSHPDLKPHTAATAKKTPASVSLKRRGLPGWWPWATALGLLALFVPLIWFYDPLGLRTPLPGVKLRSQGNVHVNPGDTHVAYITDPPASGPHFPVVPQRGTYSTPFITEYLPHFLEHGGVEVLYNSSASPEVVKKLTDVVNSELDKNPGRVVLAPRPDMPCQVSLTSWQRIMTFGTGACVNQPGSLGHDFDPKASKDVAKLKEFVERNQCQYDPEGFCGTKQGQTILSTPKPGEPTVTAPGGAATPAPATPPPATATPLPGPIALPASPTP
jgi:hypothetical protein